MLSLPAMKTTIIPITTTNTRMKSVKIIIKKLVLFINFVILLFSLLLLIRFLLECNYLSEIANNKSGVAVATANAGVEVAVKSTISSLIALNKSNFHNVNDVEWNSAGSQRKLLQRGKRFLDFTKGTRISWRTTVKNNILEANTLWGYGFGFRANFPFPNKEDRLRPFFKRDLLHTMRYMLDGHGLDGSACILKSYCMAISNATGELSGGMLFKLLRYFFSLDEEDKQHFPYLHMKNCQQLLQSHCPLSFNNISPFTDDI